METMDLSLLQKDCSCGRKHNISVDGIWIKAGAIQILEKVLSKKENGCEDDKTVLVWDENIRNAVFKNLKPVLKYCCLEICLPPENLHADNHGVALLDSRLPEDVTRLIAVGGGTIHDLCRFLAYRRNICFYSVPTAASVDGFVSTVAAMTWDGMKKTMTAVAPKYVFADTDIFMEAPYRLTASGISDLMGKYVALADWKAAHLLTGEYICEQIIHLEEEALQKVISNLQGIREKDSTAYENLMYALLLSGLAMQMVGNSRPASCAEHHMSHLWEMGIINPPIDALHGEKVSVGMILVVRKYKHIAQSIRKGNCEVQPYPGMECELLERTFGKKGLYDSAISENTPDPMLQVKPQILSENLNQLADIIDEIPDTEQLLQWLKEAGCCYSIQQIGLNSELEPLSLQLSPYVRNRLSINRMSVMLKCKEE